MLDTIYLASAHSGIAIVAALMVAASCAACGYLLAVPNRKKAAAAIEQRILAATDEGKLEVLKVMMLERAPSYHLIGTGSTTFVTGRVADDMLECSLFARIRVPHPDDADAAVMIPLARIRCKRTLLSAATWVADASPGDTYHYASDRSVVLAMQYVGQQVRTYLCNVQQRGQSDLATSVRKLALAPATAA